MGPGHTINRARVDEESTRTSDPGNTQRLCSENRENESGHERREKDFAHAILVGGLYQV